MDEHLVRTWLQLSPGNWPPDHYALIGLKSGDPDVARIEQQVYERMELVRNYQLTHPELATEVMNRLAQALVCLTDPAAKRAYDTALLPEHEKPAIAQSPASGTRLPTPVDPIVELLGLKTPPRRGSRIPESVSRNDADWRSSPPEGNGRRAREQSSTLASHTDGNTPEKGKHALLVRIARCRRFVWAWMQAGQFLQHKPTRVVGRPLDAMELMAYMQTIHDLRSTFPLKVGSADALGSQVLILASQGDIIPRLKKLAPAQCEALAQDWQGGLEVLRAQRHQLRKELQALHSRSLVSRAARFLWRGLGDNFELVLDLLALVAINLAFQSSFPILRQTRLAQAVIFIAFVAFKVAWWWNSSSANNKLRRSSKEYGRKLFIDNDLRHKTGNHSSNPFSA